MLSEFNPGRWIYFCFEGLSLVLPLGGGALLLLPHGGGGLPRHRPLHLLLVLLVTGPSLLLPRPLPRLLRLLGVPPVLDVGGVPPPDGRSLPPVGVARPRLLGLVILQPAQLLLLHLCEQWAQPRGAAIDPLHPGVGQELELKQKTRIKEEALV